MLERVVAFAARRPREVLAGAVLLTIVFGLFALRLQPSTATETLVGKGSDSFEATERYYERFGEDAVYVLVRGDVSKLVLTSDLARLLGLEGCISGNVPAGVTPRGGRGGPCARLGEDKPVKVVFGPGTFVTSRGTLPEMHPSRPSIRPRSEVSMSWDRSPRTSTRTASSPKRSW